ncbi:unnamed protein product [Kuraishia capsulata CBS 1993]|uniref:Zn(2)-C6 fungal-type domain-containing protein n=1 Tax=Kuraishia capsulata CBS 1993 TaxID=1382522 RepID=W6MRB8_9ASCO|nr:uncharacterized protein KUCA_T00005242001 [Kuraishia capsulata CBS 1993]CDK29254.1 unnamed protein product [Kuraishia capsulata CBS 1993]
MEDGSRFILFKACNSCRSRKLRCEVKSGDSACRKCLDQNVECVFDHKRLGTRTVILFEPHEKLTKSKKHDSDGDGSQPRNEPHQRSQRLRAGRSRAVISKPAGQLSGTTRLSDSVALKYYNVGSFPSSPKYDERHDAREGLRETYCSRVEPYTPFVAPAAFDNDAYFYLSKLAKCCVNIAASSSPSYDTPQSTSELFLEIVETLIEAETEWSHDTLSCFFLIPLRVNVSTSNVQLSLARFNALHDLAGRDDNLVVGALSVDAWTCLIRKVPLQTDTSLLPVFENYLKSLAQSAFSYHFLAVGFFLYRFEALQAKWKSHKFELLQLEFDMLLWPARLTTDLYVIRDELLATPEAFLLHVLHNTLMVAFYATAVIRGGEYGSNLSIFAVPGLYTFIAGMAKSSFKLSPSMVCRWSIVADCQILTANYLLDLYQEMEFEKFRETLSYFKINGIMNQRKAHAVKAQIDALLQGETFVDDESDGSPVFWVFRDIRSMTLELYLEEERKKRTMRSEAL